jgi:intracellular septation protein
MDSPAPDSVRTGLRFWLDFGPLLVFLVVQKVWGILAATAVLVPLSVVAAGITWKLERRVSRVTLIGTGSVLVFGLLTLALQDEIYIKLKVTALNLVLAGILGVGQWRGRSPLQSLLGESFRLTAEGWRALTVRFTCFFLFLAGLNEVLRRVLSTDAWVNFKVFGIIGLTLLFMGLQVPLLRKHSPAEPET